MFGVTSSVMADPSGEPCGYNGDGSVIRTNQDKNELGLGEIRVLKGQATFYSSD